MTNDQNETQWIVDMFLKINHWNAQNQSLIFKKRKNSVLTKSIIDFWNVQRSTCFTFRFYIPTAINQYIPLLSNHQKWNVTTRQRMKHTKGSTIKGWKMKHALGISWLWTHGALSGPYGGLPRVPWGKQKCFGAAGAFWVFFGVSKMTKFAKNECWSSQSQKCWPPWT